MPNHCTNNIECTSGKDIGTILKPYLTKGKDEWFLDFDKIIPMPEGIKKLNDLLLLTEITKEEKAEYEQLCESLRKDNKEKYGHESWYDWCVANWGTKWNSYSNWSLEGVIMEEGENGYNRLEDLGSIGFQTAWDAPLPIVRKLVELTGESFRMTYYDEAWMFGGEFYCSPDGENNIYFEDPSEVPEESDLYEELDCAEYLGQREEFDDEDDD